MKKPKFIFNLLANESVELHYDSDYDTNGNIVQQYGRVCTNIITKSGFSIPETFIGANIYIVHFDVICGDTYAVSSTEEVIIFQPSQNYFEFVETSQAIAFVFRSEYVDSVDANNFLLYSYKVHPDFSKLSKVWSRAADEMYMRWSLQGNLKFKGEAFDMIANATKERLFKLIIERYNYENQQYEEYFRTTKFTKLNCEFDYDRRLVTPSFQPDDEYSNVLSCINNEYDIKKLKARSSKTFYKIPPMVQTYIKGSNTITNIIGCSYFTQDVTLPDPSDGQTEDEVLHEYGFYAFCGYVEYALHINSTGQTEYFYLQSDLRKLSASHQTYIANGSDESLYYLEIESWLTNTDQSMIFRLKRKSDDSLVASSQTITTWPVYVNSIPNFGFGNNSIGGTQLKSGNQIIAFINIPVSYTIYQRLLYYTTETELPTTDNSYGFLSDDDFAYSGSVYNAWFSSKIVYVTSGDNYVTTPNIQIFASASRSIEPGQYALTKEGIYYFTGRDIETTVNERLIPVCYDAWSGISIWAKASISNDTQTYDTFGFSFINRDTYTVFNVLKAIFAEIAPDVNVYNDYRSSEFFFRNPLYFDEIIPIFTHLSNIEAGDFYYCATKLTLKLKDIFDYLKNAFRCYWFIDETNTLRIEHISWFYENVGVSQQPHILTDLTTEKDVWNKKLFSVGQNTIKYVDDDLYKQLTYSADNETTDAFDDITVKLNDTFLSVKESNEINASSYKFNVDYIFATADSNRNNGVVILLCIKASTDITQYDYILSRYRYFDVSMRSDNGTRYAIRPSNTTAIPRYALKYYMYDFYGYELDTLAYEVQGIKRIRTQQIEYPLQENALPYVSVCSYVKTKYGLGLINSISIDFDTQYAKLEISYNDTDYPWNFESTLSEPNILYYADYSQEHVTIPRDTKLNSRGTYLDFFKLLAYENASFVVDLKFKASDISILGIGEQLPIFMTSQNYTNRITHLMLGIMIKAHESLSHRWYLIAGQVFRTNSILEPVSNNAIKEEVDIADELCVRFKVSRVLYNGNDCIKNEITAVEIDGHNLVDRTFTLVSYGNYNDFEGAPSSLTLCGDIDERFEIKSIRVLKH